MKWNGLRRDVWTTSSRSEQVACVEVRTDGESVDIRDSKRRSGYVLNVSPEAWTAFVRMWN
ncbi:DUF397 domain-containing protein [Catenuloplanes nepalensis]|uniref:DUF397 domain-containing protein n=1 Tax=Catenuloplanes nepalensis TaxID=587533 RepID=UPI000AF53BCF|nr:DUF397 domain-containing protein [Catenuloplanes nepalensis]